MVHLSFLSILHLKVIVKFLIYQMFMIIALKNIYL